MPSFLYIAASDFRVTTADSLPPTPTLPPDPPECVVRYAQYLKDKYQRMFTLPDGDWPPSLGRQYTRLAMIEQERELPGVELVATMERDYIHGDIDNIVKRNKAIQLPEIFLPTEDGRQQLKILMDGAPGVGKSTLSRKICKDWANGELLQQYHLVILLPLRQERIREAKSIENLIEADDPDLKREVVQHIQKTSGEHVLLIVDGYDELSYKDRTQNSLFLDILRRDKFPKCSVLVTSRPYASDYLQQLQSMNRHVEVSGFTREQIEHYILQNIPDKAQATELMEALKERQHIVSLCYIPLSCAIVLYVYERKQCTLPNTQTKLYEIFILNAVKRNANIKQLHPRSIIKLHFLKNLPEVLQQQLSALSKLAYDGLIADKMVFSIDDLEAVFPDCRDLEIECILLGLMTAFKEFTSTGEKLSYQFLHLTFQEFLAARWAASQLSDGELLLKFFQDHLMEERYRMVLLFLAGTSQLSFSSAGDIFRCIPRKFKRGRPCSCPWFMFSAQLIYESQNFSLFHNLATSFDGSVHISSYHMLPFDCLVLAHFLALCHCSLKSLDLRGCHLTSQSLEIMHRVYLDHRGTTQIEEVNLSNNPKIITKLSLLSRLSMFEHVRVLKACGLQYSKRPSYDQVDLHCLLNLSNYTKLEIEIIDRKISSGSVQVISSDSVQKRGKIYLSLNEFHYQDGNINSQNAVDIFRLLKHNTSLVILDLSDNSQLAKGNSEAVGCAIQKMLNVNRTLKVLNLNSCGFTSEVAAYLANGLAQNYSVRKVALRSNEIGGTGAMGIFRSLEHNTSLEELDLSGNSQLAEGDCEAVGYAIERMLNLNTTLRVLNLSDCQVTDPIAKHIPTGLTKNISLVTLDIGSCTLSGSCAVDLLELSTTVGEINVLGFGRVKKDRGSFLCTGDMIQINCVEFFRALNDSDMEVSQLNVQDLTDQTVKHFAIGLAESQTFQALKLSYKNIGSSAAVTLFRSLQYNSSLVKLDLSGNIQLADGDSEAIGCAIVGMLSVNRTLQVLNLSGFQGIDLIAKHILTGLTQSKSLVVPSCILSGSCAVSQQMTTVSEVYTQGILILRVKMEREQISCVMATMNNENFVEYLKTANDCGVMSSGLMLRHQTAKDLALALAEAVNMFRLLEHYTTFRLVDPDLSENSQLAQGESEAICSAIERMLKLNSTLKVLNLSYCALNTAVAIGIFGLLEHNTSLENLALSSNLKLSEGDSEAVGCAIERMLNVNRTLKVLNLFGFEITDPIVKHILTGLMKNMSVVMLNMGSRTLSANSALSLLQQVATHSTVSITVSWVHILGIGYVEMDSKIWCTHIPGGDMIPENCVNFFKALNDSDIRVSKLSVKDGKVEHFTIVVHGAMSKFRSREHNTSLKELDLSAYIPLAEGDSEAVGCAIEKMLNVNRTLKVLNLRQYGFDAVICTHIFRSLEYNTSLEELDLSWNYHLAEGDSEAVGCAIEKMLNVNRTLKVLNLSHCKITDPIVKHILTGLTNNKSLVKLDMSSNTTSELSVSCAMFLFRQVVTHPSVSITVGLIYIWGVGRLKVDTRTVLFIDDMIPENCLEFFRALNNSGLKVSKLNIQDLTDQTAEHFAVGLAESQSVQALKLFISYPGKKRISSTGAVSIFRSLEDNTGLEELDLSWNIQLTDGDSEAVGCAIKEMLSVNTMLKVLNLSYCRLNTELVTHILKSLEYKATLEELDLSGNSQLAEGNSEAVGCAIERMLNVNRTLKVLNLSECQLTDSTVKHIVTGLTKNMSIVTLDIRSCKLSVRYAVSLLQQVTTNSSLNRIRVDYVNVLGVGSARMDDKTMLCDIGDTIPENCLEFFRALNDSGLKVSKMHVQDLTDQTAEHFAVGLAESQSVHTLILQYNYISSAGAVRIIGSLERNTSLEEFDLFSYRLLAEETVGCAIEKILSVNKTLKVLNLSGCGFTNEVAAYFINGLAQNSSVRKVVLGSNQIGSAVAINIFRSLEDNTSLEEVDLSKNSQLAEDDSEAVGCAIKEMLSVNTMLKVLNLSYCRLNTELVTHILKSLEYNTTLEELDLSGNSQLEEGNSEAVGCAVERMLKVNRTLKVLNLNGCRLGTAIATSIFRSLERNTSLEELDLSENNQLGDSEAVGCAIERMLNMNRKLKVLNLSGCKLGAAVATSIFRSLERNTSLEELDLSGNNQLGDSEAVGCAIESTLNVNRKLRALNLHGCGITDPIAKHISTGLIKNTLLVTLDIEPCTLSVSCAVLLLTHPTMRITVDEVNILGVGRMKMDNRTIQCGNDFGLIFYLSLDTLRCQCMKIDSQNAVDIFRSLEHNTSLEELDLSGNHELAEGDSEAVGCAIERMLNVNRTLKVLNLGGCNVTDPIIKSILTGLTKNTSLVTLNVSSPKLSSSCAVSLFQQMTTHPTVSITVDEVIVLGVGRVKMDSGTLQCVTGDLIPENCVEFFRALNNSRLKVTKLIVEDLTDQTTEHFAVGLAESQSVQALKLKYCNISSAGAVSIFRSLEHNTSLEELDPSENRQLAEGDSEAVGCAIESTLNVNRKLRALNLHGCGITDPIAKHISTGLIKNTSLVTLDIEQCTLSISCGVFLLTHPTVRITVDEVNILGVGRVKMDRNTIRCESYFGPVFYLSSDTLRCQRVQIDSQNAVDIFRSLEHNTSLEELDLSGNSQLAEGDSEAVGCAIEKLLNENKTLKVLNLYGCGLTNEVASYIANGLAQNHSVRKVILHSNYIGSSGVVSIFRSLEHNTSLEELDLSGNSQLAKGDSEAVGCTIERMLNLNTTLKVLNLNCCEIDTTVITHIAVGFAHSTSLAELNVEANIITSEGWVHLFKALCNSTSLKKLDISNNKLGMEGSVALAEMLSCNNSLTKLNLGCCIPEAGLTEIAKGLLHNTSLERLDISHNKLGMKGSEALGKLLSCNKSLTELNLWWCDIPQAGLKELARGLFQNTTLQTLKLQSSKEKSFLETWIERLKSGYNSYLRNRADLKLVINDLKLEIKTE